MSEKSHAPFKLPLKAVNPDVLCSTIVESDGSIFSVGNVAATAEMDRARRDYIIKAVNSHASLVDAVKKGLDALRRAGFSCADGDTWPGLMMAEMEKALSVEQEGRQ